MPQRIPAKSNLNPPLKLDNISGELLTALLTHGACVLARRQRNEHQEFTRDLGFASIQNLGDVSEGPPVMTQAEESVLFRTLPEPGNHYEHRGG